MTTAGDLIRQAAADGVVLSLTPAGRLRLTGDQTGVARWLAIVGRQYAADIISELSAGAETGPLLHERHAADATASPDTAVPVLAPGEMN